MCFFYTLCLNSDANIVPIKDSDEPVKKKKIRRKKQKTNAGEPSNIGIHFTICSSVLFCMCHLKKMTFFFSRCHSREQFRKGRFDAYRRYTNYNLMNLILYSYFKHLPKISCI